MVPIIYFKSLVVLLAVVGVCFIVLLERFILGLSQGRTRPRTVGWYGVMQCLIDRGKLFLKSNGLGEVLLCAAQFILSMVLVKLLVGYNLIGFLLILGVATLRIYGVCVAQNNNYANISSFRVISVSMSFDVVMSFLLVLLLNDLFMFNNHIECLLLYTIGLMELGRTPFDLLEAESELVSGHTIESGGIGFTFLFLSEYLGFFWLRGLILMVTGQSASLLFLILAIILIRAVLPRLKFNQVLDTSWGVLNITLFFMLLLC